MKDVLNKSQELILGVLSDGKKRTYEELAIDTGLSYDGVRGRVSELVQMGVNIQRLRVGKNSVLKLETKPRKKRIIEAPRRQAEMVSERIRSVEDFNGVGEFLASIRDKLPKEPVKMKFDEGNVTGVLVLSDLHFGEIIKDRSGKVIFNTKVANRRMNLLFNRVLNILENEEIDTLQIQMIGDMVDGDSIYKNHIFFIEKAAIEQVKDFVKSIVSNVKLLTDNGIKVKINAVRGNHGITNYKNLEMDNWDNVSYDMLDLVFADNELVDFNHFQTDQAKVQVLDRSMVLYHGDNLGGQIKTASGLRDFRGLCGVHKLKDNDIIVVGHLHQFGIESDQGKYLVRNGALPDASEYAIKLNMFSTPEQTLLVIEEDAPYPIIIPIEVE